MNDPSTSAADQLGRSYQELLRAESWQLDVGDAAASAPGGEPESTPVRPVSSPRRNAASPSSAAPPPNPQRIIEAMLFVGGQPLTPELAVEAIRGLTKESVQDAVEALNQAYRRQSRPYHIEKQESGWVLGIRPSHRSLAEMIFGGVKEARLTQAAIDVLATVAYRQPVTKQEVDTVRGHESGALLRQLVRRGLIAIASRAESGGREVHYGTTDRFLELFGLKSLDELPQTEDLQRL